MILVAIAALLGVVIGLALPKISPSIGEITGEYIASGPAADALNGLQGDDRPDSTGYDRGSTTATHSDYAPPTMMATAATCATMCSPAT